MSAATQWNTYIIGGVSINLPVKAYPSQLAMMSSIIRGLNGGDHCLLESPTGTGKSLALLCATLAWQRREYERKQVEDNKVKVAEEQLNDKKKEEKPQECKPAPPEPCSCHCHQQNEPPTDPAVRSLCNPPSSDTRQKPVAVSQPGKSSKTDIRSSYFASPPRISPSTSPYFNEKGGKRDLLDADMDDFAKDSKRFRVNLMKRKHKVQMGVTYDDELECNMCCCNGLTRERGSEEGHLQELEGMGGGCCPGGGPEDECKDEEKSHPVPKIFFATRTHKQISQVTRELARTAYGSVPMTILSSREFTCIHPEVSVAPHKAEACRELIEQEQHLHLQGKSCLFHQGVKRLSDQADLQGCWGLSRAWDIEDLVTLGHKTKACPYFAARALAAQASLIFCPYNYLIDPQIRQNIDIHLRGQIVVLDEAHNIEDSSREAASFSLSLPSICSASTELQSFAKTSETRASAYNALYALCFSIYGWMEEGENGLAQRDFELWCREWSGKEMLAILHGWGITPLTYKVLQRNFNLILEREEAQNIHAAKGNSKKNLSKRQVFLPSISAVTKGVLQGLLMVLGYLFKEEYRYAEDYRVVLARSMASSAPKPDQPDAEGFFSRQPVGKRNRSRIMSPLLTLHLWCLNPAVAFSEIAESAHCVVLSSGTLAPLTSFASELNTPFPIQLEASHVIPENQLWVGSLGQGPSGRPLCATYKNVDTFPFQDELGDLLLAVSQIIPNGLLCFVPSYRILERLTMRWRDTGLWQRLEDTKMVLCEPRGGNRTTMDCLISRYYGAVKVGGALLLGVCRGKVCEGLDFTDERARAVVTVGIPFPSFKDHQVELKRRYNDQRAKRGLLSGSHWYDIQAYRALNQALGRCIRHRNDWGCLLLVDERFGKNSQKYISGLSRWMRQRMRHIDNCSAALQSLSSFLNSRFVPNTEARYSRCSTIDIPSTSVTTTMHHTNLNSQSPHYNSQTKNSSPSSSKPNMSKPSKPSQSLLPSVIYAELPRTFLPLPHLVCADGGSQNSQVSLGYSDVSTTHASVMPLRPSTSSDLQKCKKTTIDKYFSPRAKMPVDERNGAEENVAERCEPKRATSHFTSQSLFSSTPASKIDDLSISCSSPISSDAFPCSPPPSPVLDKRPTTQDPACLFPFEPDDLMSCDLSSPDPCDQEMADDSQELFPCDWPEETISDHKTMDKPTAAPEAQSDAVSPILRRVKACRLSRPFHKSF